MTLAFRVINIFYNEKIILRRNCIMNDSHCKSYFKSGEDCPTVQNYTNIWIQLINQLERSKVILSGAR